MPPSPLIFMLASATSTSTLGAIVFEGDRSWAESLLHQVEQELERPIPVIVTSSAGELSELLVLARRSNHSEVWIVLPKQRGDVALFRMRDRTVLVRSLDPNTTDYALAIATSELVRLLESRAGPIGEVGVGVGVRFSGGLDIEAAPKNEGTLMLPAIGVALELRRWITPFEPDVSLTFRTPGARPLIGESSEEFNYRRFGLALGVGSSLVVGWLLLRAQVGFDVSFASIEPKEGVSARGDNRTVYGIEGQLGLRVPLPLGFDLELSGGATVVTNPAEFKAGELDLREGRARIRAAFALGWSTP